MVLYMSQLGSLPPLWKVSHLEGRREKKWATHKSIKIPKPRMNKHPKLPSPRGVQICPPRSLFLSLFGSGLCKSSSGSGKLRLGRPHCAGEADSEYCKICRQGGSHNGTTSSQPFLKGKARERVSGGEAVKMFVNARGVQMHDGHCRCGGWREDWSQTVIGEAPGQTGE